MMAVMLDISQDLAWSTSDILPCSKQRLSQVQSTSTANFIFQGVQRVSVFENAVIDEIIVAASINAQ